VTLATKSSTAAPCHAARRPPLPRLRAPRVTRIQAGLEERICAGLGGDPGLDAIFARIRATAPRSPAPRPGLAGESADESAPGPRGRLRRMPPAAPRPRAASTLGPPRTSRASAATRRCRGWSRARTSAATSRASAAPTFRRRSILRLKARRIGSSGSYGGNWIGRSRGLGMPASTRLTPGLAPRLIQ
jgi:hypothetical protein